MVSIFFAPLLASIPPWASGPALILAGASMSRSLTKVAWNKPIDMACAILTMIIMPLTYSIAYGLIAGLGLYLICFIITFVLEKVGLSLPDDDKGEHEGPEDEKQESAPVVVEEGS